MADFASEAGESLEELEAEIKRLEASNEFEGEEVEVDGRKEGELLVDEEVDEIVIANAPSKAGGGPRFDPDAALDFEKPLYVIYCGICSLPCEVNVSIWHILMLSLSSIIQLLSTVLYFWSAL